MNRDTSSDAAEDGSTDGDIGFGELPHYDMNRDTSSDAGVPSWAVCADNSDCMLAGNSCCEVCGQPELGDVDAINTRAAAAHFDAVCDDPDPICPACPSQPNMWLGATCGAEMCRAFDLRETDLVTCTEHTDCALRVTDCCECGADTSPFGLIALRRDAFTDYERLVCDRDSVCIECAPSYPGHVRPVCSDEGRCEWDFLPD
jgi:hypothetical protein